MQFVHSVISIQQCHAYEQYCQCCDLCMSGVNKPSSKQQDVSVQRSAVEFLVWNMVKNLFFFFFYLRGFFKFISPPLSHPSRSLCPWALVASHWLFLGFKPRQWFYILGLYCLLRSQNPQADSPWRSPCSFGHGVAAVQFSSDNVFINVIMIL